MCTYVRGQSIVSSTCSNRLPGAVSGLATSLVREVEWEEESCTTEDDDGLLSGRLGPFVFHGRESIALRRRLKGKKNQKDEGGKKRRDSGLGIQVPDGVLSYYSGTSLHHPGGVPTAGISLICTHACSMLCSVQS